MKESNTTKINHHFLFGIMLKKNAIIIIIMIIIITKTNLSSFLMLHLSFSFIHLPELLKT